MSDSLADAAGKGNAIELNGEMYNLSPLTVGDLADFEAFVKSNKIRTFLASSEGIMDSSERKEILMEICSSTIENDQITQEMFSLTGVQFLVWCSLKKKHPEMTLEVVKDTIGMNDIEKLATIIQNIGGGEQGNPPVREEETS